MNVLTVNCGSSSIKYQLFDAINEEVLADGTVSRIGEEESYLRCRTRKGIFEQKQKVTNHREGFELLINSLLDTKNGVIRSLNEISAVGHRAVHGGDVFFQSTLINEEVIQKLEECIPLAPLHNPANLTGIKEAMRILPGIPHVAIFDTAFHQTMPARSYLYAIPYDYYRRYKIRKYGFHGTSCRYVRERVRELIGRPLTNIKMIICHLGNGVTVAAVDSGRSVDTSMGLTPLEGLIMGTRSGDIDPGVIFFLNRQIGYSIDRIDNLLNKESGLLGISGVSNDMRIIEDQAKQGNERCKLAMEMFSYRVKKYIGSYAAAMGGLDILVFTAGIGENSITIRSMVCQGLDFLGIVLDDKLNTEIVGHEGIISAAGSRVAVMVVPTNEERMIAKDTLRISGLI